MVINFFFLRTKNHLTVNVKNRNKLAVMKKLFSDSWKWPVKEKNLAH